MEVLSSFMRNEAKKAQSKGTWFFHSHSAVNFQDGNSSLFTVRQASLPHPQTSSVHFLPLTLEGLLTPRMMEYNEVITPSEARAFTEHRFFLALSWVCSFSFSPALTPNSVRERATIVRGTPVYMRTLGCIPADSAS